MRSSDTSQESKEMRLKRLRIRSWRRGMKEMDLMLGAFADGPMQALTDQELDLHESLMEEADQDIYAWVTGLKEIPHGHLDALEKVTTFFAKTR